MCPGVNVRDTGRGDTLTVECEPRSRHPQGLRGGACPRERGVCPGLHPHLVAEGNRSGRTEEFLKVCGPLKTGSFACPRTPDHQPSSPPISAPWESPGKENRTHGGSGYRPQLPGWLVSPQPLGVRPARPPPSDPAFQSLRGSRAALDPSAGLGPRSKSRPSTRFPSRP